MITVKPYSMWDRNIEKRILDVAGDLGFGVGIPADTHYPNGMSVNEVATSMEFGNGNVLPRPFVRNAEVAKATEWKDKAKEELKEVVTGEKTPEEAMKEVGEKVKEDIVKSLDDLVAPPLKPSTVKAKKRKGRRNPEKPLIDSGLLRDSFKVQVV